MTDVAFPKQITAAFGNTLRPHDLALRPRREAERRLLTLAADAPPVFSPCFSATECLTLSDVLVSLCLPLSPSVSAAFAFGCVRSRRLAGAIMEPTWWRRGFSRASQMNNRKEDMEISSHYRQLLRELNEQRQHGILCDACVIVDGKIFKAHKNVLLGSSRYFKTLYCQVKKGAEPHHMTTVTHLDIVTATGFKAILDFMYSAHLALTSKNVIEVMSAASYLQMTDIVQACHGFIKAALDISIRSEMADELADFEMGAVSGGQAGGAGVGGAGGGAGGGGGGGGGGIVGMASEALASIMSGRSTSPWLARRTSPANSSGDSAIASCHEGGGGSTYGGKEEEPPKSHESQAEAGHDSQPAWPHDYRPVSVKEEQVSPASSSHPRDTPRGAAQSQGEEQGPGGGGAGGGGAWQPLSGAGRRKNRKNKDTVRHITQQAERTWDRERERERDRDRDSGPGSPLPSMLAVAGWNYNGQEIPGKSFPANGESAPCASAERFDGCVSYF
ncbi:Zinc finger and BTB domain-containing protein 46 [Liparis tanakae]|uniref:Zinc finger and BTB domain-containing protein 46 n=1 Tax=Liparis tanakae TaxID=230148 RepID=A0A4Z2F1L3_9TELE|nr:Zinc finger and BTB domain-containing protein 46 [Liparis tanakae]